MIFLLQGTIIGVVGTIVGASVGAGVAYVLDKYRLMTIPSDVYQVSYLPFKLLPWDLFFIVIGAIVVLPRHAVSVPAGGAARSRRRCAMSEPFVRVTGLNKHYDVVGNRGAAQSRSVGRAGRDGGDHGRVGSGEEHPAARARRARHDRRRRGPRRRARDIARMDDDARGWRFATVTSGSSFSFTTCFPSSRRSRTRRCRCGSRGCQPSMRGPRPRRYCGASGSASGSTTGPA